MADFILGSLGNLEVTEGTDFGITVTPTGTLAAETTVRWEIILNGDLPAFAADFEKLTDVLTFAAGNDGDDGQPLALPVFDDDRFEVVRNFTLRVWQVNSDGTETQIDGDVKFTLKDDENDLAGQTARFALGAFVREGTENKNAITAAGTISSSDNGVRGDDAFVITRFQYGDLTLFDGSGTTVFKFDYNVSIAHVNEDADNLFTDYGLSRQEIIDEGFDPDHPYLYNSVKITLSTGAVITINTPGNPDYLFQLGEGALMDYVAFRTAIMVENPNDATKMALPTNDPAATDLEDNLRPVTKAFVVDTFTTPFDISGNNPAISLPLDVYSGTIHDDLLGLGIDFETSVNGERGNDTYIITRFQRGDVTLFDGSGTSVFKFDFGVLISHVNEDADNLFTDYGLSRQEIIDEGFDPDHPYLYNSVKITLSTNAVLTINTPGNPDYLFQVGEGPLMDYVGFRSAIMLENPNDATKMVLPTNDPTATDLEDNLRPVTGPFNVGFPIITAPLLPDTGTRYLSWDSARNQWDEKDIGPDRQRGTSDDIDIPSAARPTDGNNLLIIDELFLADTTRAISGGLGDDIYLIDKDLAHDILISDSHSTDSGNNVLKFDADVRITAISKPVPGSPFQDLIITLGKDTDGTNPATATGSVTLRYPAADFSFQFGDATPLSWINFPDFADLPAGFALDIV